MNNASPVSRFDLVPLTLSSLVITTYVACPDCEHEGNKVNSFVEQGQGSLHYHSGSLRLFSTRYVSFSSLYKLFTGTYA